MGRAAARDGAVGAITSLIEHISGHLPAAVLARSDLVNAELAQLRLRFEDYERSYCLRGHTDAAFVRKGAARTDPSNALLQSAFIF